MSELFAAFGINWKLLLVQAINFGLLLSVLWYFLYRPILKMIDDRKNKVAESVKTAEAAAQQLSEAQTKSSEIIGGADREAEAIVTAARTTASQKGSEVLKAAEVRAEALLANANALAEESKRQALLESEREIAKAAMLAAEKLLTHKSA